jgi:hypothetical protein
MSSSNTSSKRSSGDEAKKGSKQPVRVVLKPSQRENDKPFTKQLAWAKAASAASSCSLPEEA